MSESECAHDIYEERVVYTIGHSNHTLEHFTTLLRKAGVTAIADVRSAPYSRYAPHFNKDSLKEALKTAGIAYVYLGKELGGRSNDPSHYGSERVSYRRLAVTEAFAEGLKRVKEGAANYRIAMMCSEKDPLDCHRYLLVARRLAEQGVSVRHILADGEIEAQKATDARLMGDRQSQQGDFLESVAMIDPLDEAYERRERSVAHRRNREPLKSTA